VFTLVFAHECEGQAGQRRVVVMGTAGLGMGLSRVTQLWPIPVAGNRYPCCSLEDTEVKMEEYAEVGIEEAQRG
jgi:hypothetical protein